MSDPNEDRLRQELTAAYGRNLPGEEFDRRIMDRIDLASGERELSVSAPETTRIWPWVLGAAAVLLLIVGAPFAWMAGQDLLPDDTLTPVAPVEMPLLPQVAPPDLSRVIVYAKGDGTFWIRGEEFTAEGLKEELQAYADRARARVGEDGEPETVSVLIRTDQTVPWSEIQKIMQACADPAIRIHKLQFATLEEGEVPAEETAEEAPVEPEAGELVIRVREDRRVEIRNRTISMAGLPAVLKLESSGSPRIVRADGRWLSEIQVLIRADEGVGWEQIQEVVSACADPEVRIFKLRFATTKDGKETVREMFLDGDQFPLPEEEPRVVEGEIVLPDGTRATGEVRKVGEFPKLPVELKRKAGDEATEVVFQGQSLGVGDTGFKALDRVLANLPDFIRTFSGARLNASPSVPHADVVRAVDGLMKVGITSITFVGTPPPQSMPRFAVVQRGDTLVHIAARCLGNGRRWPEIAAVNPGINSDALRVGQRIRLPDVPPTGPAVAPRPRESVGIHVFLKDGEKFATMGGEKVHTFDEALAILDKNLAWYVKMERPVSGMIGAGYLLSQEDYERIMAVFTKHGVTDVSLIR